MYRFYNLRLLTLACLIVAAAVVLSFASVGPASHVDRSPRARPIYDPDPAHLWNRLHEALFVRVGPDGLTYGQDRLEPLLWGSSKHLLEGPSHRRAVAVLEEFLKSRGEKRIDDPLKRAVLQRDLWLVFNWLEGSHYHFYEPEPKPDEVRAAQDRLRRPLAAVIGRLALTPEQVAHLPDNYAAAVASGAFPKRFDPAHPDQPYLPADLFAADGLWVCVGRPDGPDAPTHLRDNGTNVFTNSAFLVFLRLPAGRAATVEYLRRLRSFDGPMLVEAKDAGNPAKYLPNPKLPPLPVGTEMALVRRALLITSVTRPAASAPGSPFTSFVSAAPCCLPVGREGCAQSAPRSATSSPPSSGGTWMNSKTPSSAKRVGASWRGARLPSCRNASSATACPASRLSTATSIPAFACTTPAPAPVRSRYGRCRCPRSPAPQGRVHRRQRTEGHRCLLV
jgi:hypothetical protein